MEISEAKLTWRAGTCEPETAFQLRDITAGTVTMLEVTPQAIAAGELPLPGLIPGHRYSVTAVRLSDGLHSTWSLALDFAS